MSSSKYKKDYARCAGGICRRKEKCKRYAAHKEAVTLGLENTVYTDHHVCIGTYFFLFEEVESEK